MTVALGTISTRTIGGPRAIEVISIASFIRTNLSIRAQIQTSINSLLLEATSRRDTSADLKVLNQRQIITNGEQKSRDLPVAITLTSGLREKLNELFASAIDEKIPEQINSYEDGAGVNSCDLEGHPPLARTAELGDIHRSSENSTPKGCRPKIRDGW